MLNSYALQNSKKQAAPRASLKHVSIKHVDSVKAVLQPKLKIGQPDDKYEQEADRVAEQVMRMSESQLTSSAEEKSTLNGETIQRACASYLEDKELIQVKTTGDITPEVTPAINSSIQSLQGGGKPLSTSERSFFEPRFGTNFSDVRIHSDAKAATAARSINARAFTLGNNIAFGAGEYSHDSPAGRKLFAHELTHVIQQSSGLTSFSSGENSEHTIFNSQEYVTPKPSEQLSNTKIFEQNPVLQQRMVSNVPDHMGLVQLDRAPDVSHNGLDTFILGTSSNARVVAAQVGQQPSDARVSLRFSSLSQTLRNPPISDRTMTLSIFSGAARNTRIVNETESELEAVGHQKVIELKLSDDTEVPQVIIVLRYSRSRQWVPYPEGAFGVWRRTMVESGWVQATDGFHDIIINFATEIPGSFYSSAFHPGQHPGLGYGYIGPPGNTFYPYPRGRPSDIDLDIIRFAIHLIPVVGTLVMVGEALVGRDIWGRRISTFERAVLGAGALLSVIGPVFRAGATAVRAVTAANNLARLTRISRVRALWMIRGARNLSTVERSRLSELAAKVRVGDALTQSEVTTINRIMGKMEEPIRIAAIRAEVAAGTRTARQAGRYTDLGATTSPAETRVGQTLARDIPSDVVRVPESTAQGRRVGDYLINDRTAELITPRTANMDRLLNAVQRKQKQAGIVIVDLTETALSSSSVASNLPRLFGRPSFGGVDTLIIVEGDQIIATILRPVATHSPAAGAAIRGAASVIGQQGTER